MPKGEGRNDVNPGGEASIVSCRSCGSNKQHVFKADIPIVFPRIEDLGKPIVWVFPNLLVCLACGYTEFVVPGMELRVLRDNAQVNESELGTQAHEPAH
jgi:hypothetical protein